MIIGFKVLNRAVWTRFNIRFNDFHQSIILSACLSNRLFISLLLLLSYTLPHSILSHLLLTLSLLWFSFCPSFSLLSSSLFPYKPINSIPILFQSVPNLSLSVCLSASLSANFSPLPFLISYFTTFFSPFLVTLFFPQLYRLSASSLFHYNTIKSLLHLF